MAQSLYRACKNIISEQASGTQNIGGYDIGIEYYNQKNIDKDVEDIKKGTLTACSFGNTNQNNIVLVADDTITIPSGYTLIPKSPKKSLVIMCNEFVNNGVVSMNAKAPNVLPHEFFLLGKVNGYTSDIIIPAYANNRAGGTQLKLTSFDESRLRPPNGNNGTNRKCGSGGSGCFLQQWGGDTTLIIPYTGSGYAFGGGAGSGASMGRFGITNAPTKYGNDVNSTYPMRGSNLYIHSNNSGTIIGYGGVGNPAGTGANSNYVQNVGCGGRVIIFCNKFTNKGTISANGVQNKYSSSLNVSGGSSGGGALDIFYNELVSRGTCVANGGAATTYGSAGGNGSVTLSQWSFDQIVKEKRKSFTQNNWTYLFSEYVSRIMEET